MSLDEVFGKAEKPAEEKKLEIITSKDAMIDDLRAYFEKDKYEGIKRWDVCEEYFGSRADFLKSFELTPEIISEFNTKMKNIHEKEDRYEKEAFGLYLSALMQTSYNQGHNNFVFEDVNAYCFGAFLKSQPNKPIKITVKKLKGTYTLYRAKSCLVETQSYHGRKFGYFMKNCTIKSGNEETLELIKRQADEEGNKFKLKK